MKRRADGTPPLEPLRATAPRGDPVATLLERTLDPEPLGPAELARVRARLRRRSGREHGTRAGQLASAFAALVTGVGVAFGGWGILQVTRAPDRDAAAPTQRSPVSSGVPRSDGMRAVPAPSGSASTEREPAVRPPQLDHEDARPRSRPPAVTRDRPAEVPGSERERSAPNQLSLESQALARALVQLRRERDPRAALAALDRYEVEFPNGALRLEARVARVDALVALGDKPAVLALLAGLPLERVGRGAELRLLRAELTAERDCPAARADLDRLLEMGPGNLRERALRVRAACDGR